jgi:hypothetical protein
MPVTTIRIQNDLPAHSRVAGVLVEFYDLAGVFQTSGTTDANGEVAVTLPAASYDVFMFKEGVTILPKQPQEIDVLDPPVENTFRVSCHVRELPESLDPVKCRVTGKVIGTGGGPSRDRLIFTPIKYLSVIGEDVLLPESRAEFAPDDLGNFDFELLRGQEYNCYFLHLESLFGGTENCVKAIVPSAGGVQLDKLLFPLPVSLSFSESSISILLADGKNEDINYTIGYSDGSDSGDRPGGVLWASTKTDNSDATVVCAEILGGKLYLTPLAVGTVIVTTVRVLKQDVFWNSPPAYVSESIEVTVT